jgi:hypothetical protein
MTDTLLLLAIIIGLIAIVYPRPESHEIKVVNDPHQQLAHHVVIILWWFDCQDEINALDSVYRSCKADLIRRGKELDDSFMRKCLTITEIYYESCRAKLQLNGATDIASLN